MRFISLCALLSVLFLACQDEKNDSVINYSGFLSSWTDAVKEKRYAELNKYEYISKTADEYEELYGEYYFRNVIIFDKSKINEKVLKVKISGETVDRASGKATPFYGEVELLSTNGGYGFKIFNKVIYRSR